MVSPESSAHTLARPAEHSDLICYRPIVDLRTGRADAFECMGYSPEPFNKNLVPPPMSFENILRRAIDDLVAYSVPELMISVPANALSEGFPGDQAQSELRYALSSGGRLTILIGWPHIGIEITPISDVLARLQGLGCQVGIDNFGFSPVPLLWPAIHNLDFVRVDPRIISLTEQGSLAPRMIGSVLQMLHCTGVPNVILDGCTDKAHQQLASDHGATHVQGGLLGNPRFSYPLPK